jgi:hypothetical protein
VIGFYPVDGINLGLNVFSLAAVKPRKPVVMREPGTDGDNFIGVFDGPEVFPGNITGLFWNKASDGPDAFEKFFFTVFWKFAFDDDFYGHDEPSFHIKPG